MTILEALTTIHFKAQASQRDWQEAYCNRQGHGGGSIAWGSQGLELVLRRLTTGGFKF